MTTSTVLLALAASLLAYSNGANDNLKGFATVIGSDVLSYRAALILATITTCAGSVASVVFAGELIKSFSGFGVLPSQIAGTPALLLAVTAGAASTVLLATILGLPISTTHGLTGALAGAGLVAAGTELKLDALGSAFFLPLIVSPILAVILTALLYFSTRRLRSGSAAPRQQVDDVPAGRTGPRSLGAAATAEQPSLPPGAPSTGRLANGAHTASASLLCFSRGLNDTPKIVALILGVQGLDVSYGMAVVAVAMAAGGVLSGWKVAHTMSRQISPMEGGQGLVANMISSVLVIGASRYGLPVSTTHVTVGAIAGVGLLNRNARRRMLLQILLAWILTLPLAAAIGAAAYIMISGRI